MSGEHCLIIRSNISSPYSDVEGQSYHYKQTVANYKRIGEGVRFIMDRRDPAGIVVVGHGLFDTPESDGLDENGRRLYRVNFEAFSYFPEPAVLTPTLMRQIREQEGYNQQHSIRIITPQLFKDLVTFGQGTTEGVTTIPDHNKLDRWICSIHDYITNQGFYFTHAQIAGFYCALRTKPFVILAGISGTGKTRLPRLFAEAIGAEIRVEAVRPDWTDSADLIGYRDLNERFRPGRLLVFAEQAARDPLRPISSCLTK